MQSDKKRAFFSINDVENVLKLLPEHSNAKFENFKFEFHFHDDDKEDQNNS